MNRDVPILMYHHVCSEPVASKHFPYAVTPDLFRWQMAWLARHGYASTHLSSLFTSSTAKSGKKVVITFDDGAKNLLNYAIPILQEYGMTATLFVPSHFLGGSNSWDANLDYPREALLQPEEIRGLHKVGFEIGSHGARHINMSKVSTAAALQDMQESKDALDALVGSPVKFIAYPYGEYPANYVSLCRKAGFLGACSISSASRKVLDDPYAMRRILIYSKDKGWRFRLKLHPWYLRLLAWRDQSNPLVQHDQR